MFFIKPEELIEKITGKENLNLKDIIHNQNMTSNLIMNKSKIEELKKETDKTLETLYLNK